MRYYLYYFANNESNLSDIAVVRARSKVKARKILKLYFSDVKNSDLHQIKFSSDDKDIIIFSDY